MIPNTQWMREKFMILNRKYFHNLLQTPTFSENCPQGYCGYYQPNARYNRITRKIYQIIDMGTIYLNTSLDLSFNMYISILIHEMIHMYINTVLKTYPINDHGIIFNNIASSISKDGWDVFVQGIYMSDNLKEKIGG